MWDLRRFSAAGVATDDCHLIGADHVYDLILEIPRGERLPLLDHRGRLRFQLKLIVNTSTLVVVDLEGTGLLALLSLAVKIEVLQQGGNVLVSFAKGRGAGLVRFEELVFGERGVGGELLERVKNAIGKSELREVLVWVKVFVRVAVVIISVSGALLSVARFPNMDLSVRFFPLALAREAKTSGRGVHELAFSVCQLAAKNEFAPALVLAEFEQDIRELYFVVLIDR